MSRSFKKPIIKDKNKFSQVLGNQRFRSKSKQLMKMERFEELPIDKSEVINDYDISDYKFITKNRKDRRK